MSLIGAIERKSGEELCSAVLRYLLIRSPVARKTFVRLVSGVSKKGIVTIDDQFACFSEKSTATTSENGEAKPTYGRIDLVLETDDAVVGIENKFNAVFQNGQPKKYVDFLRDRATKLGEIRGHELIHLLVVLAPESRQKEIEEHIKNTASDEDRIFLEDCCFLSWQAVLRDMEGEMPKMDPGDAFLFTELKDYIELSYGFPRYLQDSMPQLWARWESYGTKIQRDMKDRLWYLIPEEYRRNYSAGFSKNYTGFYLMIPGRVGVDDYPAWVWFGFEDAKKVRDDIGDQKACFLISTKIEFDNPPDKITKATMRLTGVDGWTNHGYECWMVNFDDGWNRPDIWEAEFREFFKLIGPVEV